MKKLSISWNKVILRPIFLGLFVGAAFMPTFYCLYTYMKKSQRIEELNDEYLALRPKVSKVFTNRNTESAFRNLYANADHFYTENHLEKQQWMQSEIRELKFLSNYASFAKCSSLKQRLNHLTQGQNRLRLSQQQSRTCRLTQETEEKLLNPIELDKDDLCKLLVYIEGTPSKSISLPQGRPNLQFTRFTLQKKISSYGHDAYLINFDLIKREPVTYKESS